MINAIIESNLERMLPQAGATEAVPAPPKN
jgi:hypothetical protein